MLSKYELDLIRKLEYVTGKSFSDCYMKLLENNWDYELSKIELKGE